MRSKLKRKNNLKSTSKKKVKVQDVHIFLSIRIIFCKYNLWITVDAICAKQKLEFVRTRCFVLFWNVFAKVEILLFLVVICQKTRKHIILNLEEIWRLLGRKKWTIFAWSGTFYALLNVRSNLYYPLELEQIL